MASGKVQFHLYRQGKETDVIVVSGPEDLSVEEFREARDAFAQKGWTLEVNGQAMDPQSREVSAILTDLGRSGISLFIDGERASGSSRIKSGAFVSTAGEGKGAVAGVRI